MSFLDRLAERIIDVETLPENPNIPSGTWPFLKHFLKQIKGFLIFLVIAEAVLASLRASIPWMIGRLIDAFETSTSRQSMVDFIMPYIWGGIAVLLVIYLLLMMMRTIYTRIQQPRFAHMVWRQCHWYVLQHSLAYFSDDFAGRIANKVSVAGQAIRNVVFTALTSIWQMSVFLMATIFFLMQANIYLALPIIVWFCLCIVVLIASVPRIKGRAGYASEKVSTLLGRTVDSYTNILTVKLFARKDFEDSYTVKGIKEAVSALTQWMWSVARMNIIVDILNFLLLSSTALLSVYLWKNRVITTGEVAMALPMVFQVSLQISGFMREVASFFEELGRIEDSMETITKPMRVVDVENAEKLSVKKASVKFKDVTFHYGKDEGVFEKLNFEIPAGQRVGLVGKSGAGKSTIVNLLLRFYDVKSGKISVGNKDIAKVTQDSLREHIAMVTQDTSLLHRSIMDNIRYGKPEASDEEVIEAAKKAHAHEFILELEDKNSRKGYDALVGERGVKLSGGQRQRIAIARVILKNAPILILDEATSALDSEVENAIQENLEILMKGKTVIAIAHRLSTLNIMDRIVVLQEGEIVEDGTHSELLKQKGVYGKLWKMQSGGFI